MCMTYEVWLTRPAVWMPIPYPSTFKLCFFPLAKFKITLDRVTRNVRVCCSVLWWLCLVVVFLHNKYNYTEDSCLDTVQHIFEMLSYMLKVAHCKSQQHSAMKKLNMLACTNFVGNTKARVAFFLWLFVFLFFLKNSPVCFALHVQAPLDSWGFLAAYWSVKNRWTAC